MQWERNLGWNYPRRRTYRMTKCLSFLAPPGKAGIKFLPCHKSWWLIWVPHTAYYSKSVFLSLDMWRKYVDFNYQKSQHWLCWLRNSRGPSTHLGVNEVEKHCSVVKGGCTTFIGLRPCCKSRPSFLRNQMVHETSAKPEKYFCPVAQGISTSAVLQILQTHVRPPFRKHQQFLGS